MDLDRFLTLLATLFGATGSIYLLKSVAALSPDIIRRLSGTYFGFNAAQVDALAGQKADSIVGIALVIVALAVGVVGAIAPSGVRVFDRLGPALATAAVLTAGAYLAVFFIGEGIHRHQRVAANRIIAGEEISRLLKTNKLPSSEIGSLRVYARLLENPEIRESDLPRVLLEKIARELRLDMPADFDFSESESTRPGR